MEKIDPHIKVIRHRVQKPGMPYGRWYALRRGLKRWAVKRIKRD